MRRDAKGKYLFSVFKFSCLNLASLDWFGVKHFDRVDVKVIEAHEVWIELDRRRIDRKCVGQLYLRLGFDKGIDIEVLRFESVECSRWLNRVVDLADLVNNVLELSKCLGAAELREDVVVTFVTERVVGLVEFDEFVDSYLADGV